MYKIVHCLFEAIFRFLINDFKWLCVFLYIWLLLLIFDIRPVPTLCTLRNRSRQKLYAKQWFWSVDLISTLGSFLIVNYTSTFCLQYCIRLKREGACKKGHLINRIKIRTVERISWNISRGWNENESECKTFKQQLFHRKWWANDLNEASNWKGMKNEKKAKTLTEPIRKTPYRVLKFVSDKKKSHRDGLNILNSLA